MSQQSEFFPQPLYAPSAVTGTPRVFAAPAKYVQGAGCLHNMGTYVGALNFNTVALLASARGHNSQAQQVRDSLHEVKIKTQTAVFAGECSLQEINSQVAELQQHSIDCLIALGGGKCVDAGKCVAHRLGVPLIVVPTLASNDAPCSALSVMYSPEGVVAGAEFFPQNPLLVVVDTQVVAEAEARYLVAGMGDAMATWYEARVCMNNPGARNTLGAKPTMAACALGELCAHTLFNQGQAALQNIAQQQVDEPLESVVEANTLLSGIGFESGGLAAAHGFAEGYTHLPEVEHNYLHGEMVAMGVLGQLAMCGEHQEAQRVAEFFAAVGLPVHLGQLGLSEQHPGLAEVVAGAMGFAPIHNLPFKVTPEIVRKGLLSAHQLGLQVSDTRGDSAYRALHN